jgi:hypothetical protein
MQGPHYFYLISFLLELKAINGNLALKKLDHLRKHLDISEDKLNDL